MFFFHEGLSFDCLFLSTNQQNNSLLLFLKSNELLVYLAFSNYLSVVCSGKVNDSRDNMEANVKEVKTMVKSIKSLVHW